MKRKPVRIDKLLAGRKILASAAVAREYIEAGRVKVGGVTVLKPASQFFPEAAITIDGPERKWASRGAYKLLKGLDTFMIDPSGRVCVDIGASAGGFTDVLLERGASRVYAVDVGYGQLAWKLRTDVRVVVLDRMNARRLELKHIGGKKAGIITADASFISLKALLPALEALLEPEGDMIALLKPQFEAARDKTSGGVISDPRLHSEIIRDTIDFIGNNTGLNCLALTYSPIKGPEGNIEFLLQLGFRDGASKEALSIDRVVEEAHRNTFTHEGRHVRDERQESRASL